MSDQTRYYVRLLGWTTCSPSSTYVPYRANNGRHCGQAHLRGDEVRELYEEVAYSLQRGFHSQELVPPRLRLA